MDKKYFLIGEIAKMFHISMGTLRHYEQYGLLQPEYVDEKTGYRYYGTKQLEILNTIRYMRVLDIPLSEIKEFISNRDPINMIQMLENQKKLIENKQHELDIISRKIENRLLVLEDALHSELDTIVVKKMPSLRIVSTLDHLQPKTYLDLEYAIRKLVSNQQESLVFLGKIGVGINQDKLIKHDVNSYDFVYMILDDEDEYVGETTLLKESTCVSIRFCGTHQQSPLYYEQLLSYIEDHSYKIIGPSREVTLIDDGLTHDTNQFVTEITIPIQRA